MTGVENYTRAIEFKGPAYLPCTVSANLDWLTEKDATKHERIRALAAQFPDDLLSWLNSARTSEHVIQDGIERWHDEWGTGWADDGHGAKTESYPLIQGYDALAGYAFPDSYLKGRFAIADDRLQNRRDRYVQAVVWFTLFERLWMLRGFENMLMDPYLNEREFCRLRDRVVEYGQRSVLFR
jgi:hypothetical protein